MKFETLAVHAGYTPDPVTKSVTVPIYQTVSYAFDSAQHGADLFDLKVPGNIYTRIMNPTTDVLEKRVAALEGGVGALAVSSGMTAVMYSIMTIAEAGDNIIASSTLYGGSYNLFAHTFPQYGLEVRFADPLKDDDFSARIDDKTKAIFCESVGNPLGNITDIEKLAKIAHAHNIPLIVDNTVPSPYHCRPIEFGADIIVHALTKSMAGHANSLAGCIVDSGKFDWKSNPKKFRRLQEPDVSYHGVVYTDVFGEGAYIARARVVPLRNTGGALSPMNSWLILQGIETLPLRADRASENALAIAKFLSNHPKVSWVNCAALEGHRDHALCQKYMKGKAPSILSFGVKPSAGVGPREAGAKVLDAVQLFTRLVNIGDTRSLITHSASTTHRQLSAEELAKAGVSEDMIRLSIGIENIDDLLADLDQALAAA
ncbi:MAG: O-acetylhomoserine aminocarboxypropyltransferase/cysteine synthase [Oxalobacter sp.]|nr:O-acetylhomoserine aminocarboxypropyltransferase/cysteine synthase [Oxalobacter sp.]